MGEHPLPPLPESQKTKLLKKLKEFANVPVIKGDEKFNDFNSYH